MGKKRVEMKLIEDKNSRQVTFSKRRKGLVKKARELSVLCDAKVALLIFSGPGNLYEFCNGDSLTKVLQQYSNHSGASGVDSMPQFRFEFVDIRSGAAFSQFVKRHFGVSEVEHLSMTELMELERITHSTLSQIRSAKMNLMVESVRNLKKKELVLVKENELLEEQIAASKKYNEINNKVVTRSEEKAIGVPYNLFPGS